MDHEQIRTVVIVGGGTAGWIAASALSKLLPDSIKITLIESKQIGTVGVGEATIPQIRRLNGILGMDENEFVKATNASFKLGIEFNNWGHIGERYLHTFGDAGINLTNLYFHQYWLRSRTLGSKAGLWDYSLHHKAAYQHKFGQLPRVGNSGMTGLAYAFHFDAGLYAAYLRQIAEGLGTTRKEGKVVETLLDDETGFINSVKMEDGTKVSGDLFIDCSGFRALLIGQALGVGYEDWSKWLPANHAVTAGSESTAPLLPYTKATAHTAGWQWRIPLQHRTGNGHVFCDEFMSVDEAGQILMDNLDSPALAEPRAIKFTTGRRKSFWHKNCVSLGLASGFMEPLESTSIHLIQSNVSKLIELFPTRGCARSTVDEYNRQVENEYNLIRDFLILHYHRTDREDSEFWRYCAHMDIPESLKNKMQLFSENGLLHRDADDLFRESSWVQVMIGQGLIPKSYHAMADRITDEQLKEFLHNVRQIINKAIDPLPDHQDYISRYCAALQ